MRLQGHRAQLRLFPWLQNELSEAYSAGVQEMRLKLYPRLRIEAKIRCHGRTRLWSGADVGRFPVNSIYPARLRPRRTCPEGLCPLSQPQTGERQQSSFDGFMPFLETATDKWRRPSRWGAREIRLLHGQLHRGPLSSLTEGVRDSITTTNVG